MSSLVLWESKYASKPTFSIRFFIADVQKNIERKVDTKRMHINLISCLNKPEQQLLPDPSPALDAFKKRHQITVDYDYKIPELEAFQIFVAKWFKLTPTAALNDIVNFCVTNLDRQRISNSLKNNIEVWFSNTQKRMHLAEVDVGDLRKLSNLIYMAYCEVLGPIKADELLAKSIDAVRNNGGAAYSAFYSKLL